MTVKERLHQLVETLPESETETAERVLRALHTLERGYSSADAPFDNEPYTDRERAAVAEALDDIEKGRVHSLEDARKELGL